MAQFSVRENHSDVTRACNFPARGRRLVKNGASPFEVGHIDVSKMMPESGTL